MYTQMNPSSLTNKELIEYAERLLYGEGTSSIPRAWQREIVKRLNALVNN